MRSMHARTSRVQRTRARRIASRQAVQRQQTATALDIEGAAIMRLEDRVLDLHKRIAAVDGGLTPREQVELEYGASLSDIEDNRHFDRLLASVAPVGGTGSPGGDIDALARSVGLAADLFSEAEKTALERRRAMRVIPGGSGRQTAPRGHLALVRAS